MKSLKITPTYSYSSNKREFSAKQPKKYNLVSVNDCLVIPVHNVNDVTRVFTREELTNLKTELVKLVNDKVTNTVEIKKKIRSELCLLCAHKISIKKLHPPQKTPAVCKTCKKNL